MAQIYPCFISYRHTGDPEAAKYVREFKKQLQKHIASRIPNGEVYLDEDYLMAGMLDPKLAHALCSSACWIIFYSRFHFDHAHPYCAREYKAMIELEEARKQLVAGMNAESLIFVVARRDFDRIPGEIKGARVCHDFGNVLMETDFRLRQSQAKLDRLAEEIANRYTDLMRAKVLVDGGCDRYALPAVATFQAWMDATCPLPHSTMPGH